MAYTSFFATRNDIILWLSLVEAECKLKYISSNFHVSSELEIIHHISDIPNLGISSSGNHQDDALYMFFHNTDILSQKILRNDSCYVWRVGNPLSAVCFYPGGMYGDVSLIHGHFGTIFGCDDEAVKLKKILRKYISKVFTKNGRYYFGPEANSLGANVRLIQVQVNEPIEFDYKKVE